MQTVLNIGQRKMTKNWCKQMNLPSAEGLPVFNPMVWQQLWPSQRAIINWGFDMIILGQQCQSDLCSSLSKHSDIEIITQQHLIKSY